ncbi:MAG: hypothetical protein FJ034_02665, partial [Chloroflexi bacterium]|nr:hypothetical protein [Chloroflexota bacterium]
MTAHPIADLSAYADGALAPAARDAVAAHLDACSACSVRLADLRAVSRALGALEGPLPRRSLMPRLVRP